MLKSRRGSASEVMSNLRQEQAEICQGLLVRSSDRPSLYWSMEPTIRLTNDQRAQRCRAAQGAFRLVRLLPAIPPSTFENWQSKFCNASGKRGDGNVYFWGCSLSRESDDRLAAKIERLLSEDGIDRAQFDYREEAGLQAKA